MKYIFLLSWLAVLWLGSAWEQGLIGAWGMWTSLGIAFTWAVLLTIVKYSRWKGGRKVERNQDNN